MTVEDPYDLNALHAIDDQLAQIVPESEWEALSAQSDVSCEADGVEFDVHRPSPFDRPRMARKFQQVGRKNMLDGFRFWGGLREH